MKLQPYFTYNGPKGPLPSSPYWLHIVGVTVEWLSGVAWVAGLLWWAER